MKLTVDTNILVRTIVKDDLAQAEAAMRLLATAEVVAVSNACLCELVWVLRSVYRLKRSRIATALREITRVDTVIMNYPAVDAGLAMLEAGGDFADGVIAHEGAWLGGDVFVSFDKQAVALVSQQGRRAELVS